MNRHQRRKQEKLLKKMIKRERQIFNSVPTMIHENNYKKTECTFCGDVMETVHDTHNPYPLREVTTAKQSQLLKDGKDRCCHACNNDLVHPARLKMINSTPKNLISFATADDLVEYERQRQIEDPNFKIKPLFDMELLKMP